MLERVKKIKSGRGLDPKVTSRFSSFSISDSTWSKIVIICQSVLVSISLIFYFLISFHQISFSKSFSVSLQKSPRRMAFIITIVSTTLSAFSSFLFSRAIINWLSVRIKNPTPLYYLSGIIELSRGKWMLRASYLPLSFFTILVGILLKTLTASWATLLTPTRISVTTPVEGNEIDLGSLEFNELLNRTNVYPNMIAALRSNNPTAFGSLLASSGIASAYSSLGIPRFLEFDNALFDSSTGGVLPIGAMDIDIGANSGSIQQNLIGGPLTTTRTTTPQNQSRNSISQISNLSTEDSISGNHTIRQQGFTANVNCDYNENLSNFLVAIPQTISFPTSNQTNFNTSLTKWSFDAHCPNGDKISANDVITAIAAGAHGGGLVSVTVCHDQDIKGVKSAGNHREGYGYLRKTVCTIAPRLTILEIEYTESIKLSKVLGSTSSPQSSQTLTNQFLSIIQAGISGSQDIYTNTFGDGIRSIYSTFESEQNLNDRLTPNQTLLNQIMEKYFQGQAEFVASYLKSSLSGSPDIRKGSMTKLYGGEWYPTRMGWDQGTSLSQHSFATSTIALVPIIIIGMISIIASIKS
ncbi:hypothetical protein BY996DRAFT_4575127, partial [Phakopsora pachyrhizi]